MVCARCAHARHLDPHGERYGTAACQPASSGLVGEQHPSSTPMHQESERTRNSRVANDEIPCMSVHEPCGREPGSAVSCRQCRFWDAFILLLSICSFVLSYALVALPAVVPSHRC